MSWVSDPGHVLNEFSESYTKLSGASLDSQHSVRPPARSRCPYPSYGAVRPPGYFAYVTPVPVDQETPLYRTETPPPPIPCLPICTRKRFDLCMRVLKYLTMVASYMGINVIPAFFIAQALTEDALSFVQMWTIFTFRSLVVMLWIMSGYLSLSLNLNLN